jgi:hypothetical protein
MFPLLYLPKNLRIVTSILVIGLVACQPLPYSSDETLTPTAVNEVLETPSVAETTATETTSTALDLPTAEPLPQGYPGPELLPNQLPPCKFSGASATEKPSFQDVQFSEPQLLLPGNAEIIQMLPDNRRVLLMRWGLKQKGYSFETLDFATGETHVYAYELEDPYSVAWLDETQSLAFVERKSDPPTTIMWLSKGDPANLQVVMKDLGILDTNAPLPEMPAELARYLRPDPLPVDPTQWRYNKYPQDERLAHFANYIKLQTVLRPNGSMAAFYGFPWLFLADTQTYQPCEVDIQALSPSGRYGAGMHATRAEWSADGRFLAMLIEPEHFGNVLPFSSIAMLDTVTGAWYEPDLQFLRVQDMAWLADSRHLVAQGKATREGMQRAVLIDALTAQFSILPFDRQAYVYQDFELATSPDGRYLVMMCGEDPNYGVCLSAITLP